MPKYYINNDGRLFKKIGGRHTIHEQIDDISAQKVLKSLSSLTPTEVEVNGETIKIIYSGHEITFDARVFDNAFCKYLEHIVTFQNTIKENLESKQIAEHKETMPKKVNRKPALVASLVVTGALVGTSILYALTPRLMTSKNIENKKPEDKPKTVTETVIAKKSTKDITPGFEITSPAMIKDTEPEKTATELEQIEFSTTANSLKTNEIRCALAFEDETGRFMEDETDSNLYQTNINCVAYLEPLIDRYGLPHDLTYAMTTQEDGTLSLKEKQGACGPMQLQVGPMHKEHFKVPVYRNGKMTGEYDEFWVADAERLDDPFFEGKKVLVIQNLEDNFQIGTAYLRRCIDRYKNIFLALDAYNKGLYALTNVYDGNYVEPPESLEYYQENFNDFSWTNLINLHYQKKNNDPNYVYGDPNYLWNVLKYLSTNENFEAKIDYYYNGELISVILTNTNYLDNALSSEYNTTEAKR